MKYKNISSPKSHLNKKNSGGDHFLAPQGRSISSDFLRRDWGSFFLTNNTFLSLRKIKMTVTNSTQNKLATPKAVVGDIIFGSAIKATTQFGFSGGWTSFDKYPRQVADVNGDGRADIIGFGGSAVVVALGQSNGTFANAIIATTQFNFSSDWTTFDKYPRQVADVNGDGRADIIGFGGDVVVVALGQSNGTFANAIIATTQFNFSSNWTTFDKYPRQVADVNGDGRADIIGFGGDVVVVALGQSNGTFANAIIATTQFGFSGGWTTFDKYPRQVADVNGDGRADIVAFGGSDAVFVALGQSNGTFASATQATTQFGFSGGWTTFDKYPRQLADVNGDGRADIVAFGGSDAVFVALGQSNGTFASATQATTQFGFSGGWTTFDKYPRQLADVNGDGRADIVAFGGSDAVFVALGQSNGTFASATQATTQFGFSGGWTTFDKYPRQVADVNGDGRADIVGFGGNSYVHVALSQSSPPTISVNNLTVTEGNSGNKVASFRVSLSKSSSKTVTVNYLTGNGTAIANSDYVPTFGTLFFSPGQTSKNVSVRIKGDVTVEKNETFFLKLSGAGNGTIAKSQGIATIKNDDFPSISIKNVTVTEGNSGTKNANFVVTLSNTNFGDPIKVSYRTINGTAFAVSDYVAKTGVLTFNPGQKTQIISIPVRGDVIPEANERFFVQLFSPQNGKLSNTQGTGTINNDDFLGKAKITSIESDSFGESDNISYDRHLVVSSSIKLTGQKAVNPVELDRYVLNSNSQKTFTPTVDRLLEIITPATTEV